MEPDFDLVPVEHDPFADVPGVGVVPTQASPIATSMARGVANQLMAPGNVAQGQQPTIPGQWSDVDEATAQLNARGQYDWAAQQALNMVGSGTPFAEAGAAGIFGGKLAKTADLSALERAQRSARLGATPESIWNDTGWFQGPDKQWRFEIPDQSSVFNQSAMPPKDYTFYGKTVQSREGAAGDVITHPELFAAYPDLAKTMVGQTNYGGMQRGIYHPPGPAPEMIGLEKDLLESGDPRSTMLHELQHAVQQREGFASGSNPQSAPSVPNPDIDKYRTAIALDRDLIRYNQLHASPEYQAELNEQNRIWREQYQPQLDQIYARGRDYSPGDADAIFEASKQDFAERFPTMAETDRLLQSLRDRGIPTREPSATLDPYEVYRRTAGEVEARNVQGRMNVGPVGRQAMPPWTTEDVPRGQQIIVSGGSYKLVPVDHDPFPEERTMTAP